MASREGLFAAAYALQGSAELDAFSRGELDDLLAWFRQNLKIPPRFNRTKSKNHDRRDTRGLSWFKPTARQHLDKAFELAELLTRHGIAIEVLRAARIGYVIYEDDHQLVAEPFADVRS
ncbi:hypothetical protein [Sinorhizobium sp. A49]|uniref:hypothetical protein n=1 Tax=Sinorhizobium sp. A49 TaxID=1945861 RepID=UPI001FD9A90E|nr:hypothetical protein [Sinorhizobium sp. A49]